MEEWVLKKVRQPDLYRVLMERRADQTDEEEDDGPGAQGLATISSTRAREDGNTHAEATGEAPQANMSMTEPDDDDLLQILEETADKDRGFDHELVGRV